jgi:uncharacterized protein YcaQ
MGIPMYKCNEHVYEASEEELEQLEYIRELQEQEHTAAVALVSKALAEYRWWGWKNLTNHIRMFVTRIRVALGMRLWP